MRARANNIMLGGALLFVAACRSSTPTELLATDFSNFSATINGVPFSTATKSRSAQVTRSGIYTISGVNSDSTTPLVLSLSLYYIKSAGVYPLGVAASVRGGNATLRSGSSSWSTPLSGAAGTLNITSVSDTRVTGTFSFVALPAAGTVGTKTVQAGEFDIPIADGTIVVVSDNSGGSVAGTIGGAPWTAATLSLISPATSGALAVEWSNTSYRVNVVLSSLKTEGTYALNTDIARYVRVIDVATGRVWGGADIAGSGTFVVTSLTATRITGHYNVLLPPADSSPTAGTLALSGNFDVPIYFPY